MKIIPLVVKSCLPFAQVSLAGVDAQLLFDLGGSGSLGLGPELTRACAHSLFEGGADDGYELINVHGERVVYRCATLTDLSLGPLKVSAVPTMLEELDPRAPQEVQAGFFSSELFEQPFLIDYAERRLVLGAPPPVSPESFDGAYPSDFVIRVSIDGRELVALLDTGCTASYLRRPGAQKLGIQMEAGQIHSPLRCSWRGRELCATPITFEAFEAPQVDLLLGYHFFERHRVWIHPRRRLVALDPLQE